MAVTALLPLTACATAPSSLVAISCPPLKAYTAAQLSRAADELSALSESSVLAGMSNDYRILRNQVRACQRPASR